VLFGPHVTNLGRRRTVSDRHVAYYRRRAAGGAGIIVTEEASVHPGDWPYERAPLAAESVEGWASVASACHAEGALVVAAIGHCGGQGSSAYSQLPLWAPSGVPGIESREVPKEMEMADIEATIAGFGAAAAAAVDAGLDGVEINAGQHSLVRQFLSGLTNQRDDGWGTDPSLYVRRVVAAARAARPPIVGLRLCCNELAPWAGITPDAAAAIVAVLAPLVDYLVVVRGSDLTTSATRPDGHVEPGFNRALTAAMRTAAAGRTEVIWQGSVVDVDAAERALADGVCDGVEMTRAQIADPDLVAKTAHGRRGRIRPCILCNQACMVRDVRNPLISCVVEPSAGHETEEPPVVGDGPGVPTGTETGRERSALVIGAGPAGLEAARVLALSGWAVTVVERRPTVGGALALAAGAEGRADLRRFTVWLEAECRRLSVRLLTDRIADAAMVAAHDGPVIIATGGRPSPSDFPVDPGATVLDAARFLTDAARGALPDGPALVWDPVGGPVAVSVAETMAATGRAVTLVVPDRVVATLLSRTGDLAPVNVRLLVAGVTVVKEADVVAVGPATVDVADRFGAGRSTIEAGFVVDCGPRLPDDAQWPTVGPGTTRVGDVVAPRTVLEAVLEGRRGAQAILASDGR
jgi:mycofactocin system FadH/OYE family oxidoreductase 1